MEKKRIIANSGAILTTKELENYLEKMASKHNLSVKSSKETYPIPRLLENYSIIKEVYEILNEHVKQGISIHPAGEWILDNFYIIEETVKSIKQELTLKKYKNFVGIKNGINYGFARIYVLATEIVNYTDNKIYPDDLEKYLTAYQTKKTLNMDEIWNIGIFLQIAIIENIRQICEKIYISQIEKYKVETIIETLIENRELTKQKDFGINRNFKKFSNIKYPFIEYMSYKLKRYGKKTEKYLEILEDIVEKTGSTVSEIIKKEHFDIATNRVSISNCIISIKKIQRINFLEIFEKINGVEEILKNDPARVYENMDNKTKDYYRQVIKEIASKSKISEIYISRKLLELAKEGNGKSKHIGYYLFGQNKNILYEKIGCNTRKMMSREQKIKYYITMIFIFTILISLLIIFKLLNKSNFIIKLLGFIILIIPVSEFVIQIFQYVLSKFVKPKMIPKLDLYGKINKENATMVVIPTILKNKEKVKELMKKLEIFYLANKSKNLYFCLLGDATESKNEIEKFDKEIVDEGINEVNRLNLKYQQEYNQNDIKIFNFVYRKRKWNESQNSYLGWERKRGAITEFVELLLGKMTNENIENNYHITTLNNENINTKIKYLITLDSDTDLILNTAFELVGAMGHILNRAEIKNGKVVNGYGLIQPRVGVNIDISYKNMFTKIFSGSGGIDSYTNAISDTYQDNFDEGIFTGKGIFDLEIYSKVLKGEIPENIVLSHDLLEGCYLRCGLASDIMIMDGYPAKYVSFMSRLSRWIRGDWQIIGWIKNSKINLLSKFKILDNLRRSLVDIFIILGAIYFGILTIVCKLNLYGILFFLFGIEILPFLLEIINIIILKKEGEHKQDFFTPKVVGTLGASYRAILTLGCLPYKAFTSLKSIIISIYRMYFSKRNLLEWTTSEETEKLAKDDMTSYYKNMYINVIARSIRDYFRYIFRNISRIFIFCNYKNNVGYFVDYNTIYYV